MRIAVYNIMGGGFKRYNWTAALPERLPQLQAAVRQFDAHFVGLIDTFRWLDIFTPRQIAELFGYPTVSAVPLNDRRLLADGCDNGLAALSTLPQVSFQAVRIDTRDCLQTVLPTPAGPITIFLVYLDDVSWQTRVRQITALRKQLPEHRTIVMGDMNTIAVHDYRYIKPLLPILFRLPGAGIAVQRWLGEREHWEPLRLLEEAGLRCATTEKHKTIPTGLLEEFPFLIPPALFRIDYVFHTPDLRITNMQVMRGGVFDKASDHYPLVFEVE